MKPLRTWLGTALLVLSTPVAAFSQLNTNASSGRFERGTSIYEDTHSFVISLDRQLGMWLWDTGSNTDLFAGVVPWCCRTDRASVTNYHLDFQYTMDQNDGWSYYFDVDNPIVAFGSTVGGSALYTNETTRFGIHFGAQLENSNPLYAAPIRILVYQRTAFSGITNNIRAFATNYITIPRRTIAADQTAWTTFVTNNETVVQTANGLRTEVRLVSGPEEVVDAWGTQYTNTVVQNCAFQLSHTGLADSTNYYYVIEGVGVWMWDDTDPTSSEPMVYGDYDFTVPGWSTLYAMNFDGRPKSKVRFLDQPQFRGDPLPPDYTGKSDDEWTQYFAVYTNMPAVADTTTYRTLDNSPELRRHPLLDQLVIDLRNDPIALASFVVNEIALTDPMGITDQSIAPKESVNLGGINRSALATYLERQGSPAEQCALLVYLLRQAGYPTAYVWPTNNLKILDTSLSKLMRMQVSGAVNPYGISYSTNSLITVNWPWVATRLADGTTVQIFPWMKDTEVDEGLNLSAYLPTNYNRGYQWVTDYVYGSTNILGLSQETDLPLDLFKTYVSLSLLTNYPGLSLDDFGVYFRDRRTRHTFWSDFTVPNEIDHQDKLKLFADYSHFTDVYAGHSNVFNAVRVQVLRSTTTILDTGSLRMCDLHTRKFLLYTNSGNLTLWLAPYRTNITGQSSFSNDPALTNKQVLSAAVQGADTQFTVRFTYSQHRDLSITNASYDYLDTDELLSITNDRPFFKGELASLCFNVGCVSPQMVRVHAEDFWRVERSKQINTNYAPTPDEYQGTAATIMGLSYFEQTGSAFKELERLFKVRRFGAFDFGLAKMSSKVVNSVNKTLPVVDMQAFDVSQIANSTLRPDLGGDFSASWEDAYWHFMAQGSALEHRIINGFFVDTNAISTVKLLQLAQKRSGGGVAGIVQLYKQNYVNIGNSASAGYGSTLLKNYDPATWALVTDAFNGWDGDYVRVFITPAPQTNNGASYRGMGALIIGRDGFTAAIEQNLNGGWGSYEPDFNYSSGLSYLDYSLGVGPNDSMYFNYNRGGDGLTFDSVSTYDAANFFGGGTSLFGTPDQQDTATQIGLQYGQSGSTFQSGYFTAGDSGFFGNPDWLSSWGTSVSEPVNPLTGEFYVDTGDLTLPGPFPLQVRRNYLSQNRAQNQFGVGWKWALTPYLVLTNSTQGAANTLIYATEMDGAVVAYRRQGSTDVWKPQVSDNPSLNNNNSYGIGSTANILNAVMLRVITNSTDVYLLTGADGSVRRYELKPYAIASGTTTLDRTRPYLTSWRDNRGNALNFIYGQDGTAVNYGQVVRIESSNGDFVEFVYDSYARIVEAFTADGRHLSYAYDLYGDLMTVTLPDATEINYSYGRYNYTNSGTVYRDSNHLLTQELKFDGRQLINQYDALRRVTNQLQTIGADLTPIRSVTFYYSNNYNPTNLTPLTGNTLIVDVFGKTNRYDYNNGEVTTITDPLGQTITQQWYADNATVPGYPRSLQLRKEKRGLWTQFKYDTQGNITNMLQFTATGVDNLTGESVNDATTTNAAWTALYTTNNLLQQTVDPAGNTVQLTYDPVFTWLPSKAVKLAGGAAVSTNLMFYYSVTNSITNGSLVYTQYAAGLLQKEARGGVATNEWQYDGRGFRTQETRYARTAEDSSNTDPAVVTMLVHDSRGELVEKDDALGRGALFDFDAMGRPKWTEVYNENGEALARTYSYYSPNGELVWSTGPQMKPDNYVWRDYDGGGRKITEIVWRSEALADLSDVGPAWSDDLYAVSQFEYDSFGNQTKVIDPRGNYVVRRWDSLGRLTQEEFYGADNTGYTTNRFGYEAGGLERFATNGLGAVVETRYTGAGKPRFRQNADGSTQSWTYYLGGRPRCEFLINGSYWTNIYQDAQRKLTRVFKRVDGTALATNIVEFDSRGNTIRTTDGEGNVFNNSFDGLDRIKVATGPAIQTVSYDPSGGGHYTTNVVQQSTTHIYDNCGQIDTVMNALGEKTVRRFDKLGRLERMDILNTSGASVRNSEFVYTADNHYVQAWEGTGATETYSESYLDHAGRAVLAVRYASASTNDPFTRAVKRYDKAGNLVAQQEDGDWYLPGGGLSGVTVVGTNGWTYDGLNRVQVETSRDGAATTNQYNAIGNAITRFLPGGLKYVAGYTPDGRMTNEYVLGSGTDRMNERNYGYFAAGSAFAGRLQSVSDTRGVARTNAYDDWGRLNAEGTSGSQAEYNTSTSYQYDRRSLMTQISRSYTNSATGPSTTVNRSFDAYSQLAAESVTVGSSGYSATPAWNSAGRRSGLSLSPLAPLGFGYRADGAMTNVSVNSHGAYGVNYTYGDNGLLYSRSDGTKTVNYTRDEMGRLTGSVIKFGSTTNLTESLTWRSDTRLLQAVEKRSTFTDTRSYQYAGWSRFLTNEQYYVSAGTMDTQDYQFDQGGKGGLGVLTGAADWDAASSGGLDTLKRPVKGTTTYSRVPAFGKAFGAASVSATLNGQPVAVDFTKGNSNGWFYAQLLPQSGTNFLAVTAVHPSNLYSNTSTSVFTNNATSDTVTNLYDSFGNVTRRVWRKASGGLVRQQDFTWNAFNQLVKLSERDANSSGFDWTGAFDGFGRRLRVTETQVISNTASASLSTIDSYYDPGIEFLELGMNYNGRVEMKVFGPDVSCAYGGAQGIGGLEAVVDVASGSKNTILNDRFGNVLGYAPVLLPSSFQWSAARFHSCGPKVGYETPFLASGVSLVQTLGWQGQRRDVTGLYYWNARPYDPMERRWLTIDPAGIGDMGPYGYGAGDAANRFDPDGLAPQLVGVTYDLNTGRSVGGYYDPGYLLFPTPYRGGGFPQLPPRAQGVMMMVGGGLEAGGSIAGAAALSPSVVGSIPFVAAAAQGGGLFGAGLNQVITGEHTRTPTAQVLDLVTGNPRASDLLDTAAGMGLSFYTGAAGYRGVVLNSGEEGNAWLLSRAGEGAVGEFPVATELGTRRLDVYAGTLAQESKVGEVANSTSAYTQMLKDEDILSRGLAGVEDYEWHLFRSAQTGEIGMAPNLMSEADRIGINVVQHGGSGWSASETLFGPAAYGLSYDSGGSSAITLSKH